ncbi:TPA: hypothetical protein EYP45_03215 [Candidatus Peregrinibacteria bacterium]|nr:hypothetical protein [Candidatus Peregrinibacteria bacterium]
MNKLVKKFWELSRGQQENFIDNIYGFSKDTKDIFSIWLEKNEGEEKVLKKLLLAVQKETSNKIGKSRKVKVSNINNIIKNAKKYPLSNLSIITLYFEIWTNFLDFLLAVKWVPERYQKSCGKFVEDYFLELDNILDTEVRKKLQKKAIDILEFSLDINRGNSKSVYVEDLYLSFEVVKNKI